ncbi:toprim domain-containing protein [Hymenobacter weizhouensis]|uniref:toprim domain-containing protein n=1 Tax=Hymenobacter sp. YIM 151500-1 TaxID=2987689 RepID=UPI002227E1F3|nr:toprim domain-containing protein [Hymenobacter sp. YIM 151500-1]UYZ65311.1 toprim domain-containing protein [Hymenobacter sp. YIM 151500-1]
MEHELTFQKIKEQVELPELLSHFGYTLKKGEHLGRGKWYVFEGDDTLVVFKGRGGDWMYFNAQDDRDKGSVIDWMKNRVSSGRIAGIAQPPGRNLWQAVNDHFRTYLNLPEQQRPRLELPSIAETAPGEKFHSIFTKDCRPLEDTTYLEGRGISQATLRHPQFVGRILNHRHTVQRPGLPPKTYVNTAFPAYHEGRVVGLELKGDGFKGQAPESQFSRSLWLSRLPEARPATVLVVSESALDTLSYAQLHPQESALYASTAGTLTQNKIFELQRLLREEHIPAIRAAFDNDTQGHHFDTRLLAGLASDQNPMKVVREHEHQLTVEIVAPQPAGVQALSRQLQAYNEHTSQQFSQANGAPGTPATDLTLREQLIHSQKLGAHTYQFHVPMNAAALAAFNLAASQTLAFAHRVEIAKSQGKDWNQDLKQDQLQRVVQRELSPVDEDQHGFGQEHWDNPAQEGLGKIARQHEAQATARAGGQRLLVVELRESRDAVALLPALRENLERVGLTIDHATKHKPGAAREIVTELTLRYAADSPQLLVLSDTLDALRQSPHITVVEPPQDAAERRQQAAAREQTRQAGAALVPSGSAARDQARHAFIHAAGQVARELRKSAATLDAARLQEVSRQLLTKATLTGVNQENVGKVLAVVDTLETVKASPAVIQLRQAAHLLQQPTELAQEVRPRITPRL